MRYSMRMPQSSCMALPFEIRHARALAQPNELDAHATTFLHAASFQHEIKVQEMCCGKRTGDAAVRSTESGRWHEGQAAAPVQPSRYSARQTRQKAWPHAATTACSSGSWHTPHMPPFKSPSSSAALFAAAALADAAAAAAAPDAEWTTR